MRKQLRTFVQNISQTSKYLKVLTPEGYAKLLKMEMNPDPESRYSVNVRQIGGKPIEMRAGTSDCSSLLAVYFDQYHVPPVSLRKNGMLPKDWSMRYESPGA